MARGKRKRGPPRRRRRSRFDTKPTPAIAPLSTVRHGHPAIRAFPEFTADVNWVDSKSQAQHSHTSTARVAGGSPLVVARGRASIGEGRCGIELIPDLWDKRPRIPPSRSSSRKTPNESALATSLPARRVSGNWRWLRPPVPTTNARSPRSLSGCP